MKQAIRVVSIVVATRKTDVYFGKTISDTTMPRWLITNGFMMSKPLTSYQVKARVDRVTLNQLFNNIKLLRQHQKYPLDLIFNMDECWVATEKKQIHGNVIHPVATDPINHLLQDANHVTLIGCIAASGRYVEPVYIIPSELKNQKKIEEYLLDSVDYIVNRSGYMNGYIFNIWITNHLIPYVNKSKKSPDQHALLICDAHLSRINEEALITLKMNNIDLLILPAHSTSKLQPLDVGIYSPYKQKFRTFYKGKGGLYHLLYASQNAVQCSFLSILIRKAWATSHLLEDNPIDFINSFTLPEPGRRKSRTDYANRILVSRYMFYTRT